MPDYIQDPNDSKKQVPGPLTDQHFDRVKAPIKCGLVKQPHYVMIASTLTNDISFYFGSSASYAADANSQTGFPNQGILHNGLDGAPTGSVITSSFYSAWGQPAAGTTLIMNPCAWSGSAADAGKVKFVYKGGLDGMGRP
tara:strand:+ start:201 stop:620 length:420 start_codon:yes stop_codon:yes gene_type:complete